MCLEVVRKVDRAKGRTFGILVACTHVYCLACITEWREKVHLQQYSTIRRCTAVTRFAS